MKKRTGATLAILLILLDQITKFFAKSYLEPNGPVDIIKNVFSLEYLENTGIAFGMFKGQFPIFVLLTLVILAGVIYLFVKLPKEKRYYPLEVCLVLVTAGAIGNMIDRVIHNYVIDFLYFNLIDFPIFNVADCYVVIAVILLFILILFYYKDEDFELISSKMKKKSQTE